MEAGRKVGVEAGWKVGIMIGRKSLWEIVTAVGEIEGVESWSDRPSDCKTE